MRSLLLALALATALRAAGTYTNPILPGFHPDPSLVRVGQDYYLTSSTFEIFPGLPIYHSQDLVHWELLGNALDRPSQLPLKTATDSGGLYAPGLRWNKGTFYLTCTNFNGKGAFYVTAKDARGPWSEPVWLNDWEMDATLFFDDDGKVYYTKHAGGERAGIAQQELDLRTGKLGPARVIYNNKAEPWNEGPRLYKFFGKYYLLLAEGGTGSMHQAAIARSDSPWGPFEPSPHGPMLTHRDRPQDPLQATGHADLFQAHDGSWWTVFLAVRSRGGVSVLGRQTCLAPVSWTADGWPIAGERHHVALEMPAPKLAPKPWPAVPERDDFKAPQLGPDWVHVRNMPPAYASLRARQGWLRLQAAKDGLSSRYEDPAFCGQRQPDFKFVAQTRLDLAPAGDGEEAGLCVRANDANHYEVGLEREGGKLYAFVRNTVKESAGVLLRQPVPSGSAFLRLAGLDEQYQFAWSPDGKAWRDLGASPAADLSRDRAAGFTGAVVGLYATANGRDRGGHADFDWFQMKAGNDLPPAPIAPRPTPTPQPASAHWRLRAGGPAYTDKAGQAWSADQGYSASDTAGTGDAIQAPEDPALYQTERWGADFSYRLPVPPGRYRLSLRFAETFVKGAGERVFDVSAQGKPLLQGFDIYKEAGGPAKGILKRFDGIEADPQGFIVVRFKASKQNAKVCALELERR